jgi:hypothetical protein
MKWLISILLVFSGPGTVAQLSSSARQLYWTSAEATWHAKAAIDAREYGVDCSGVVDSSEALNAITGNPPATNNRLSGHTLMFPPQDNGIPCKVNLATTWFIKNQSAFIIDGLTRAGQNGTINTAPYFFWTGAVGGTLIDMEYVDGFEVRGLAIHGQNGANIGINVDKVGPGGIVNTTDGFFHNLNITTSDINPKWTAMAWSLISTQNVENMRLEKSSIGCGGFVGTGLHIGNSQNAKQELIFDNSFFNCGNAIWKQNGSMTVELNEFSHNSPCTGTDSNADIRDDANTDTDIIRANLDENGSQFLNCNGDVFGACNISNTVLIESNNSAPVGCQNPSHYWINAGLQGIWTINNNTFDALAGFNKIIGTGHSGNATINTRGNRYPNETFDKWWTQNTDGLSDDVGVVLGNRLFAPKAQTGIYPALGNAPSPMFVFRGYLRGSTIAPDDYALQSIPTFASNTGSTFLIKHQQGDTGTAMFAFDGSYPGLTVAQIPTPGEPNVTAIGTTGSTSYTYSVVAYYGYSYTPGSPTEVVAKGNAALSSSNYNRISWSPVIGATKYCVWLTATSGAANLGKIGCTSAIMNINSGIAFDGYTTNEQANGQFYIFDHISNTQGDFAVLPSRNTTGGLHGVDGMFSGQVKAASFVATSGGWKAGSILAIGDVVCPSADMTASDCPISASNYIGIAIATSSTIYPQTTGFATLNYDATVNPSAGWFACVSALKPGKILVQATPCPRGQKQIGIVASGGTSVATGSVWLIQ